MQYVPPIGGDPNDPYIDANPALGVEGSPVPAAAIEHPMREIMNVILAGGIDPDSGDLTQLSAAIQAMIAGSLTSEVALQGAFRNLTGSASGFDADVDYVVDEIVLGDGSGNYAVARNVTETITMSTSGAGGLDTGAVAASTWYYGHIIGKDDGTVAAIASLSATSPTLPAGYTKWARVGAFRTDATANKYPLGFTQRGNIFQYKVEAGSNVPSMPLMASGLAGSVSVPTWVAVSTAAFAPPTASKITVTLSSNSGAGMVAPNSSYGAYTSVTNPPPMVINTQSTPAQVISGQVALVLESQNIYWANNTPTGPLACLGFEDNL